MKIIPNSSHVLMSDSIANNLQDMEQLENFQDNFIMIDLEFAVSDEESFNITGSVSSYLFDEHVELEVKVTIDDAFSISKLWPNIILRKFQLFKGDDSICNNDPYKVAALRIQEINHAMQMCVIAMKICKYLIAWRFLI